MWEIEFYETHTGRCPVQDFIDDLDPKGQAKVLWVVDLLQKYGPRLGMPYAKHIGGELWELRIKMASNQYRIIYFLFTGKVFVLLHGFAKKTSAIPRRDLEIARERYKDFSRRRSES